MARRRSAALARFRRDCRAVGAQLGRVLGFHCGSDACPVGGGPGRHLRLPAAWWTFAAGDGRRPGGDHRSADIRHAGVTLGALCAGLPPESRSQVYATLRARSGFHCADILERPLACSGCGVDRHCGGRGCFRAGVAGDAGVQGDSALLGACALDSMAAAAGALADTRRDAP
jgi:hypothetical protein